jgi:hypothetical protein
MNLREAHGWTYGEERVFWTNAYLLSMLPQVRNAVTDNTVIEIFKEFKNQDRKVTDEMLASVKAGYIGRFVMQIENHKQWQDML